MDYEFVKYLIFLVTGFIIGSREQREDLKKVPDQIKGIIKEKTKKKVAPRGQIIAPTPEWVNKSPKERETENYLSKRFKRMFERKI